MPWSLSRRLLLTAAALTVALVSAAAPALAADPGSRPNFLTSLGTRLLFIADDGAKGFELWRTDADDGVHGLELWRTTSSGVKLWANIKPE